MVSDIRKCKRKITCANTVTIGMCKYPYQARGKRPFHIAIPYCLILLPVPWGCFRITNLFQIHPQSKGKIAFRWEFCPALEVICIQVLTFIVVSGLAYTTMNYNLNFNTINCFFQRSFVPITPLLYRTMNIFSSYSFNISWTQGWKLLTLEPHMVLLVTYLEHSF